MNAQDYRNLRKLRREVAFLLAGDFVAVDTETTGTGDDARIVEVAAVKFVDGRETDHYASLVNPEIPIPAQASEIHGITDQDVAGAPAMIKVLFDLLRFWRGYRLLAYNADFDRRMLANAAIRCGMLTAEIPPLRAWIDPMKYAAARKSSEQGRRVPWPKLTALAAELGVEIDSAHRAEDDARAAGQVWIRLTADERKRRSRELLDAIERGRQLAAGGGQGEMV